MVNFLVVTHGDFGAYAVEAAEGILGEQREGVRCVAIAPRMTVAEARERIAGAVAQLADGDGLVICTDMPGGTPANLCLPLAQGRPRVAVLTGLNLYMLVTGFAHRALPFEELTRRMLDSGVRSIADLHRVFQERSRRT